METRKRGYLPNLKKYKCQPNLCFLNARDSLYKRQEQFSTGGMWWRAWSGTHAPNNQHLRRGKEGMQGSTSSEQVGGCAPVARKKRRTRPGDGSPQPQGPLGSANFATPASQIDPGRHDRRQVPTQHFSTSDTIPDPTFFLRLY